MTKGSEKGLRRLLVLVAGLGVFLLFVLLLLCVIELPPYGAAESPVHNEVSAHYLTEGLRETGSLNVVTAVVLDYRAFDTFGEAAVLLLALLAVSLLLEPTTLVSKPRRTAREALILQKVSRCILPPLWIYASYIMLSGQLGPGGGFSGGVFLAAGGILQRLCAERSAQEEARRRRYTLRIAVGSMLLYAILKLWVFFRAGNELSTYISLGIPGTLLSGGLIPILNLCIGLLVGCAIYLFYSLLQE